MIATFLYLIVSAACMAYVAGKLLIRACNAWTRPDDALAAILRCAYHMIYAAEAGQLALGQYRAAREYNRAKLAQAMLPLKGITE